MPSLHKSFLKHSTQSGHYNFSWLLHWILSALQLTPLPFDTKMGEGRPSSRTPYQSLRVSPVTYENHSSALKKEMTAAPTSAHVACTDLLGGFGLGRCPLNCAEMIGYLGIFSTNRTLDQWNGLDYKSPLSFSLKSYGASSLFWLSHLSYLILIFSSLTFRHLSVPKTQNRQTEANKVPLCSLFPHRFLQNLNAEVRKRWRMKKDLLKRELC